MIPVVIKQSDQNRQVEIYEKSVFIDVSDDFETIEQTALKLTSEFVTYGNRAKRGLSL